MERQLVTRTLPDRTAWPTSRPRPAIVS
ncbi:hypothetical protein SPHV1_610041 [Novosphingobium sp. KN65.2]|nr:hypothetical protein SPHV1_610041 [Novosphingobium sp. KN65.2]